MLVLTPIMRKRQDILSKVWLHIYHEVFSSTWPIDLLLSRTNLTVEATFRIIFNLRDNFVSALKFCPGDFVERVWFQKLFGILLGPDYSRIPERGVLIDKIAIMDKISYIQNLNPLLQKDINSSTYKVKYICTFIKNRMEFDPNIILM